MTPQNQASQTSLGEDCNSLGYAIKYIKRLLALSLDTRDERSHLRVNFGMRGFVEIEEAYRRDTK